MCRACARAGGDGVRVKVTMLGSSTGREETVAFEGSTLADLRQELASRHGDALGPDAPVVGFVNARGVIAPWEEVVLREDDAVMLVTPISGG